MGKKIKISVENQKREENMKMSDFIYFAARFVKVIYLSENHEYV